MKKTKNILLVIAFALSAIFAKAQTILNTYSPERLFDTTIVDTYGNRYTLNDLVVDTISTMGSGMKTTLAACSGTNAGYFDLYLQPGCGFEPIPGNPTQSAINAQRLSVLCQVYIDISNFITNRGGLTNRVRIIVKDIASLIPLPALSGVGAMGGSFYTYPYSTTLGGIIDSEMWKTINSGQDSYIGITSPMISSISMYHGQMAVNFANTSLSWHTNLLTAPPTGTLDLYTFVLHEVTHSLGFNSFINYNGNSIITLGANKYVRYDLNLKTQGGQNLITNGGGCALYNYSINPAFANPTNTLSPGNSTTSCAPLPKTTNVDLTDCSKAIKYGSYNTPVYTPNCFEAGTSLSHFEDMCPTSSNNNLIYTMSNIINFGSMKRYLKEEERKVLCDIGYTVAATYGTSTYTTTQKTYTNGICNGISIIGINDGLSSIGTYTIVTNVSSAVSIQPLTNDIGSSGGTYTCVQVVNGSGSFNITSGNSSTPFNYTPSSGGLHLLRYIPVSSGGVTGNITYIYVKVLGAGTCSVNPPNNCEMVYNGDFEANDGKCGFSSYPPQAYETHFSCWSLESGGLWNYIRNCTTQPYGPATQYTLPCTTTTPQFDTWNLSPNNSLFSSLHYFSSWPSNPCTVLLGALTSSLVNSVQYKVSFWVKEIKSASFSYSSVPQLTIHIAGSSATLAGPFPLTTYPASTFSVLTSYAVPRDEQWHNYSAIITYTGAATKNITFLTSQALNMGTQYVFDDLSIIPASAACTFTIPPISCSGITYTLNSMVSVPNGTFTGPGVTYSSPNYIFTANSAGNGLKTISYTYTTATGCTLTAVAQTSVTPTPTLTVLANPPAGLCPSYPTATITASGATTYTFAKGATTYTTNPIVVSPTVTTTFTLTGANATCTSSVLYTINVSSVCLCAAPATNTMPASVNNYTNSTAATWAVNQNLLVQGNSTLGNLELLMSPGVKITVDNGATLTISKCHLYSCFDMWQGIEVSPGGRLIVNNGALIEDAITAVNSSASTITATPNILDITDCAFNKNYTGISVMNYTPSVATYPYLIRNCVFTSRTLTFTPTSWPSSGYLKTTCTPTNALGTPYCFQNFPFGTLKAPYTSGESSYYGVYLQTVGATANASTTPTYYSIQIGDHLNTTYINVFDNLFYGIWATDVNLKSMQNTFQNTQYRFVHGNYFGGIGIEHRTEWTEPNTYLLVKAPAPYTLTRNNKFYDCTYAIRTNNIFEVNASNALIQSTQTSSGSYQRGKYGVYNTTDRFKQYDVSNNLIYNIEFPIAFNTTYGQVNFGASSYTNTQYAGTANLSYNTIAPVASGAIGSEFVSDAITAQNILSSGSTQTLLTGAQVSASGNALKNIYRGVYGSNFATPPMYSSGNTVTLSVDPTSSTQWGISNVSCKNSTITTNNVLGPNTTNTAIDAIYAGLNNTITVTCNTVSTTYQGFEFSGSNPLTAWKGNSMQNHIRGMILNYTASIGQQGSTGNPMDNAWNGTWTSATNYQTWTDNGTFATGSPLYTRSVTPYFMPTLLNSGNPNINSYGSCCTNTTTGSYSCGGGGGNLMAGGGEESEEAAYFKLLETTAQNIVEDKNGFYPDVFIAQYQLYRTLELNPALQSSNKILGSFYSDNKTKSYGKLLDGEIDLTNANYSSASTALSSISSKNSIENNYNNFYNLYSKYYTKAYTNNDNTALLALANKCPFLEGEVVYQARALYNVINSTVVLFKDNCPVESKTSSRLMKSLNATPFWDATIYPNPASNELFIKTSNEKEELKVVITDVNGRVVADYLVKTNGFIGNIRLNMNSGIYFVTLSNSNNDKAVKKLVITK